MSVNLHKEHVYYCRPIAQHIDGLYYYSSIGRSETPIPHKDVN